MPTLLNTEQLTQQTVTIWWGLTHYNECLTRYFCSANFICGTLHPLNDTQWQWSAQSNTIIHWFIFLYIKIKNPCCWPKCSKFAFYFSDSNVTANQYNVQIWWRLVWQSFLCPVWKTTQDTVWQSFITEMDSKTFIVISIMFFSVPFKFLNVIVSFLKFVFLSVQLNWPYARIDKLHPPVTWLQCLTRVEISDLFDNAIFLLIMKKLPIIKKQLSKASFNRTYTYSVIKTHTLWESDELTNYQNVLFSY